MKIETTNNEIKLTFSKNALELSEIQGLIDYVKFREVNSISNATQEQADEIDEEIKNSWWEKNKSNFE